MSILDLILGTGLMLGGHEFNHLSEAQKLDVPISGDAANTITLHTDNKNKAARIAGAGFEGQDIARGAAKGTGIEKSVNMASAMNKFGYALMPGSIQGGTGDVNVIEQNKGTTAKQAAQVSLFLSGISDMHKAYNPDRQWDLNYWQSNQGSPGLKLSIPF